jgi:DNA-binding response OmpR family regulator
MRTDGKRTTEKSVLIVEDDRWSAEAISMLLESDGFVSRTARSGAEALKEVERANYDVVLLDIALADTSGDKIGRAIHERAGPPIVIMSAAPDAAIAAAARASHAAAVLRKPFDSATLRQTLANVLARPTDHPAPAPR